MTTLDLDALVLERWAHGAASHQMCVMEAVAYVAGEPWTDRPKCASPVISAFLRAYNDQVDDVVRQTLKPLIPKLVGTRGSDALETVRANMVADWLVRVYTPAWLRLGGLSAHADILAGLAELASVDAFEAAMPLLFSAKTDSDAAAGDVAARAAAGAAAACDAAWAAARADAARDAARAAACDAACDAAWAAARAAAAWAAMWSCADAAARAAEGAAFKSTVENLQSTVVPLLERMIAATERVQ